jgi:hypothetical protein
MLCLLWKSVEFLGRHVCSAEGLYLDMVGLYVSTGTKNTKHCYLIIPLDVSSWLGCRESKPY